MENQIDKEALAKDVEKELDIFLRLISKNVEIEFVKISSIQSLWLQTVDSRGKSTEIIRASANLRYAGALVNYMREESFEGKKLDSYVTSFMVEATKKSLFEFYMSERVKDRIFNNVEMQMLPILKSKEGKKLINPSNGVNVSKETVDERLKNKISDVVISQSFQDSMTYVLEELRDEVIVTAVITSIITVLAIVAFSIKGSVVLPFLLPLLAALITYKTLTFKSQLKEEIKGKLKENLIEDFPRLNKKNCDFIADELINNSKK